MSVYCTWLMFERQEDGGAPYVYQGSHVVPRDGDPRGGWLEFGSVPNHCHPDADRSTDDMARRVEFARLGIAEDKTTYGHGEDPGSATVVLDRRQVTELRDVLTAWLDAEERW